MKKGPQRKVAPQKAISSPVVKEKVQVPDTQPEIAKTRAEENESELTKSVTSIAATVVQEVTEPVKTIVPEVSEKKAEDENARLDKIAEGERLAKQQTEETNKNALAAAELARQKIAEDLQKARRLNNITLFGAVAAGTLTSWLTGFTGKAIGLLAKVGLTVTPGVAVTLGLSLLVGASAVLLVTNGYKLLQTLRFTDKARYDSELAEAKKINTELRKQISEDANPQLVQKLKEIADSAVAPIFDAKENITKYGQYNTLTVLSFENSKLAKRAELSQQDREKWDAKFVARSETEIENKVLNLR